MKSLFPAFSMPSFEVPFPAFGKGHANRPFTDLKCAVQAV